MAPTKKSLKTFDLKLPTAQSDSVKRKPLIPLIKWAGGKRWLLEKSPELFEIGKKRLIEPFFGGGAIFFGIQPKSALIADANSELILTYQVIADSWEKVVSELRKHQKKHSSEYYYQMRSYKPRSPINQAARFIYLNRTCWNGLYRVNLEGRFNVPKGSKSSVIRSTDDFESLSTALEFATIRNQDFEVTINQAGKGDFVFADPPYAIESKGNGFVKYNECIFSWDDQKRLKECLRSARKRGAEILLTNANHKSLRELYGKCGEVEIAYRNSVISGSEKGRRPVSELIVRFD